MMNTLHKSLTIALLAVSIFISGISANLVSAQSSAPEPMVALTPEEKSWIKAHSAISLSITDDIPPRSFIDKDGKIKGSTVDYVRLFEQKLGLKINLVGSDWATALKLALDHEVDGILQAADLEERKPYLNFTQVYSNTPMAVIAGEDELTISGLDALCERRVGVLKDSSQSRYLMKHFPCINVVHFKAMEQVAYAFAGGEIHAVFGNYDYYANHFKQAGLVGFKAIYIKYLPPMGFSRIGLRNDEPLLLSIFDKAIAAITDEERARITNRLLGLELPSVSADLGTRVNLTPEEQAWLAEHQDITFGFADQYEPFLIKGADGNLSGILIDFLNQMNARLGTQFTAECAPWGEILEKVERRELAGTLTMTTTAADARGLLKTETQFNIYPAIFARSDAPFTINGLDDLRGRSVAILEPSHFSEKILEPLGSEVDIKRVHDDVKLMQMLYEGKVDAVLTVTAHNYILAKFGFSGIQPVYTFLDQPIPSLMGVRPDWPELVSILNKGIASFSQKEMNTLLVKWINVSVETSPSLMFTEAEKAWLKQNHTVQVRVTDHVPYMYYKDGEPVGIAVDLINAVSERTGIKFHFVMPSPPFAADLKGLIQHAGPDLIASLRSTPEREKNILFTKPYLSTPVFIFTRDDAEFVSSMGNLSGKTVAVVKNYVVHTYLAKNYPDINLLICKNNEDALKEVSSGQAFAFIGGLLSTSAMINEFGLKNLKVVAPSTLSDHSVAMGIRNDWPELRDIMNKAIGAIPQEEKAAITNKWSTIKFEHGIRAADVVKWILLVVGAASGIVLVFVFWNRSLTKQVNERTSDLVESEMQFRATFEQAAVGVAHVSLEGKFLRINRKFCDIVGYSEDEMLGLTFQEITHPDDLEIDLEYVQQVLTGKRENYSLDKRYSRKDGSVVWVNLTVSLLFDKGGNPEYFVSVIKDISERKEAEKELKAYQVRLKSLASQLALSEETERRRIAVELHDHIGQTLAFSCIQIARTKKYAPEGKLATILDEISQSLLNTIQEVKGLIFDLSPPLLHEIGLAAAISNWLEDEVGRKNSIRVKFVHSGKEVSLKKDISSILFRNVRELLCNVIKHAQATEVVVSLVSKKEELVIIVRDDGVGFDPDGQTDRVGIDSGFGLFSVKQQIEDFGGQLEIDSKPGKGCKATLRVPIKTINTSFSQVD